MSQDQKPIVKISGDSKFPGIPNFRGGGIPPRTMPGTMAPWFLYCHYQLERQLDYDEIQLKKVTGK